MAITFPLRHPTKPGFKATAFRMDRAVDRSVAKYNRRRFLQLHSGREWEVDVELPPMRRGEAAAWQAFFAAIDKGQGTFLLGDVDARFPQGSVSGTPQVDGAGQTGTTLNTKLWTPNATAVLAEGDYIQIGSGEQTRLHMVTQSVTADAGGLAAVEIWPDLRESPADSEPLVTNNCVGTFTINTPTGWSTDDLHYYGVNFVASEAF